MSIRFQCGSCTQPIEVDEQWSARPVICPYCRATVTAPRESTLADTSDIPTAHPLGPRSGDAPSFGPRPYDSSPPPRSNAMAAAALVLILFCMALLVAAVVIMRAHWAEIEPFANSMKNAMNAADADEVARLQSDFISTHAWFVALLVVVMGSIISWVAAVVCGLIGLRRAYRRSLAIAALVVAGLAPVLLCCGGVL